MEKISRNNYEIFFLDYLEGNLDPLKTEELFSFLILHPDLKKELDDYEMITLDNNKEEFENKDILKKFDFTNELNDFNFEQFCVAYFEGDLNEVQKARLDKHLTSNPDKSKIFEQYELSRLKADESIIFFGKDNLRKGSSKGIIVLKRLSIAASLLFVAGLSFFLINREDSNQTDLVAGKQNPTEIILPDQPDFPVFSPESSDIKKSDYNKSRAILANNHTTVYKEPTQENIEVERIKLNPVINKKPELGNSGSESISFASLVKTDGFQYDNPAPRDLLADLRRNIEEYGAAINTDGIDGSGRLTIWDIADAGINGFSKLTGADVRVDKKKDEEGNVTALAFQSKNLNFTKRINY
jgi:hypothetical protein